ncbi:hypothetical protein DPMN_094383 [Dreissena polymorpha]|uniref:Uncharacterized protein n=3 Tax=Dreissena polymorpha TaxID=45954 RepID=A0A9D4R1S7_DREPO|nr:hypothetical protein DPMN_094383 [Dreissena polymorpha]
MSEPAINSSRGDQREYVNVGDMLARESFSDSMLGDSRMETPQNHSRSQSCDSILDGSTRRSSLRRGQPNSLKAGLLHGDQKEVHKLRRSFGLDKSDIGYPMPISVADVSHDGDQSMQLDCSVDLLMTDKNPANMTIVDMSVFKDVMEDSPGSVSRTNSSLSLTSAKSERADEENGYECDNESEVGSVVSKALKKKHIPLMTIEPMTVNMKTDWTSQGSKEDGQKSLVHQKQESKDSLLSEASSAMSPLETFKSREMTRTLSADSGKGSICEEPQDNVDSTLDSVSSLVLNHGVSPKTTVAMETLCSHSNNHKTIVAVDTCSVKESLEYEEVSTVQGSSSSPMDVNDDTDAFSCESPSLKSNLAQKSVSTQDLQRETDTLQSRVSRSKSLLETSVTQKKTNIKPNLQISAETHKLLARAGYIKEQKTEMPKTDFDFTVPNTFPIIKQADFDFTVPNTFPFIKQAEMLNPRRESIIALQKNNAGRVKNNVLQFDKISEEQKELEVRHASPLRFPNSTSRKLRTPTLFNRSAIASNKDIDAIRQCLSTPKEKLQFGTAKVPISTQLIKPSDPDYTSTDGKSGTGLKRKPSIYKADHDASIRRQRDNSNTVDTMDCSHLDDHSFDMSESVFRNHQSFDMSDSVLRNHPSFDMSESLFGKTGLDQSLLETIANVCSPLSEKVKMKLNEDKIGKGDKENSAHAAEMPDLKPSILGTPISMDMVRFRTASNKTPLEIMKVARSPRSPIKPLKRLGSSPHSPRSRVHSPNLIKNSNRSRLSTIPNQSDDLNNL